LYTAYLIAAIVMTLSVAENHSYCKAFHVRLFVFVARRAVPPHLRSFSLPIRCCTTACPYKRPLPAQYFVFLL